MEKHLSSTFISRLLIFGIFIFTSSQILAQETYTVKTVPNPKTINNTWVSDPGSLIAEVDKTKINQLIDTIEKQTTAEIAVVVLPSIGEAVPKDFAVDLFNTWGIGKKGKDNGLLLLIVMDQRRWEFETGYGLEGDLPDITLKRIGESQLVPGLKAGQIGKGIYDSINAVAEKLGVANTNENSPTMYTESGGVGGKTSDSFTDTADDSSYYMEDGSYKPNVFELSVEEQQAFLYIVGIYAAIVILITLINIIKPRKKKKSNRLTVLKYGFYWLLPAIVILSLVYAANFGLFSAIYYPISAAWVAIKRWFGIRKTIGSGGEPYSIYQKLRSANGAGLWILAVLFPIPVAFIAIYFARKLRSLRLTPRSCPTCNTELTRLDEKADDFFLDKGQVKEEQLGSVDYDVWHCSQCNYVKILSYDAYFTSYNSCPSCSYKTYHTAADRTIRSPTCSSSGTGEREYKCEQCNYSKTETYHIPARDCSSSSSSSSSGGGFRSSSSGGGSFGGGRSGGGGAGGSW